MDADTILRPLERALRFFAILTIVLVPTQMAGLVIYLAQSWPRIQATIPGSILALLALAMAAGLTRTAIWILLYWNGAKVFRTLGRERDQTRLATVLAPRLARVSRLLIASCVLDVLFLPAFFWNEVALPVWFSGWRLGLVEIARVLFPQAIGLAAVILAYLTRRFSQLLAERAELATELELTI